MGDQVGIVSPLTVFTDEQLERIHRATLEVLQRTGIRVMLPEAVDLLRDAGCQVDGDLVHMPGDLVEWALDVAPSHVVLGDRDGNEALRLEGRRSYYGTGSDCTFVIDPYTGERRKAVLKDVADFARLVDALPHLDFVMTMSVAQDLPAGEAEPHQVLAAVSHTVKPLVYAAGTLENLKTIVRMCQAIAGGAEPFRQAPFTALLGCPTSPLMYTEEPTRCLLYTAEEGLPYITAPSAVAGGTAPMTLAGSLIQINAEMLAGLVMAQLRREGAPYIVFGGCPIPMDMKTTIASYASPEFLLFHIGLTQLDHYQGLPVFGTAGCTDSKVFDQQASMEGALSMLVAGLSGANLIHDVGYVEYGSTSCFEQVVVMDEMAGQVRFMRQGITLNEETMALDVIHEVGPGGEFITTDHTFRHFRDGWMPDLVGDRNTYEDWVDKGSKTLGERANERVRHILETHQPKPLPEEIREAAEAILAS